MDGKQVFYNNITQVRQGCRRASIYNRKETISNRNEEERQRLDLEAELQNSGENRKEEHASHDV